MDAIADVKQRPSCHQIDQNNWPRRNLFQCFRNHDYPTLSITSHIDVTDFRSWQRDSGLRLFASLSYILLEAAQRIPSFRQRFDGDGVVEYDSIDLAVTVARDDGTFAFARSHRDADLEQFHDRLVERMQNVRDQPFVQATNDDAKHLIFITSLPWLFFTGMTHPVNATLSDIPILTIGKLTANHQGRIMMPVAVQAHHALVDGLHIAQLIQAIDLGLQSVAADP